jgi:hypothetical protein
MNLVVAAYRLTDAFPHDETYGLAQQYGVQAYQLRQASLKVAAETTFGDTLHDVSIATGSLWRSRPTC